MRAVGTSAPLESCPLRWRHRCVRDLRPYARSCWISSRVRATIWRSPWTPHGKKAGRVSFNLSWVEKRGGTGRQDRLFQSYNQIKGALGLKGKSVGDVVNGMMEQPLAYVVQELYQGDKDPNTDKRAPWFPVTDENRKQVNEEGRRLINTLNGVRPIKA